MQVVDTIQSALNRHDLIPAGATVVAGVSGGADSVALLRVLHQLEIPVTIAHLNHQLRGKESDGDEHFVCDLAEELSLPVIVKHSDVRTLAADSNLSIEMAARRARHAFFSEFENGVIALAHHADDQVETFMLRMGRGAGSEGLGGMPFHQRLGDLQLIRPMLGIPRADILEWLTSAGFTWREDVSNLDESFLRNRIRHTILPFLEKELNPNLRETILRTMDILRKENKWMDVILADLKSPIADLPIAARRRALRKWLFDQDVGEIGFDAVEKLLSLMDASEGTKIFELNDQHRVVVEYGVPRLETTESEPLDPTWRLTVERGTGWNKDHGRGVGILPAEASFNAEKVGDEPIEVRTWRPGDRMKPLGMSGSRKLQDIFTDEKIPKAHRPCIPIVVCGGEIIWLPGYRTAKGWEVDGAEGSAIHVLVE
jgi:tRNA(Ile)-lysidine synthase